jgi:hypothetical protein
VIFTHIYLKIIGETKEPMKQEFHGNYALETLFIRVSEHYFGKEVSIKIEAILTGRI